MTNLPFDALKIDRHFVTRLEFDENCVEVVKAVVSLAHFKTGCSGGGRRDTAAVGMHSADRLSIRAGLLLRGSDGYGDSDQMELASQSAYRLA